MDANQGLTGRIKRMFREMTIPALGLLVIGCPETYPVTQAHDIEEGDTVTVEKLDRTFKYAELWRSITHWYNPRAIYSLEFSEGGSAIINYNPLTGKYNGASPEVEESFVFENNHLKKVSE